MKEKKVNNETEVLKILSELVSIPSYGKIGNEHEIIKYLQYKFKDCCETIGLEDEKGNYHLLVGVNHKLHDINDAILLSGHIDTVVESEGHTCNVSFDGNELKGLGVSDMKSFVATLISNLDYLKSLNIPVIISLTSDEETQLLGIKNIIQELNTRNINASMIIVGEPTDLDYYVSSRGNSIYVSIMNGITCHSGTPDLGINAIDLQLQFIMEVTKLKELYEKDSAVCVTHIDGGKTPSNVVPDGCSACFCIRTSDLKILNKMYDHLLTIHSEISQNYGESKLFSVLNIPPFERRKTEFLTSQIETNGKKMIDAKYATEAGYFQNIYPNANIVIYGPGNPENIHKAGEFINQNNLFCYGVELRELLNNYLVYRKQNVKKLVYKQTDNKN